MYNTENKNATKYSNYNVITDAINNPDNNNEIFVNLLSQFKAKFVLFYPLFPKFPNSLLNFNFNFDPSFVHSFLPQL